jgi:hypothetical protein
MQQQAKVIHEAAVGFPGKKEEASQRSLKGEAPISCVIPKDLLEEFEDRIVQSYCPNKEDVSFEGIWTYPADSRKCTFQSSDDIIQEAWRNVLYLQQTPIVKVGGVMKTSFSSSADPGVMVHA